MKHFYKEVGVADRGILLDGPSATVLKAGRR
jgi:hypothetical protein